MFLDGRNGPYEREVLRKRLNRACRRASLPERPPYAWRHFFGTMQAASGTNLAILAQVMGHTNLQTTNRYIANNDEAHIKAVAVMEKFV